MLPFILLFVFFAPVYSQFISCSNDPTWCKHGGICTERGITLLCTCRGEWTGRRCDLKKKGTTPQGELPACPEDVEPRCGGRQCVVDQECTTTGHKCCKSKCGKGFAEQCYTPKPKPKSVADPGVCLDSVNKCMFFGSATCKHFHGFLGFKATTASGKPCQPWAVQYPHRHRWPQVGAHNFCRNPNGNTAPWCYTQDPETRWEYCYSDCDKTPCQDKQSPEVCAAYVSAGQCEMSHVYYYPTMINCCLSCKKLKNPDLLKNVNVACEDWAREGKCEDPKIRQECQHLCTTC